MARARRQERAESAPASQLPAPYRNPWALLVDDLRAVSASLVLELRRLWRRQWQGELPVPPFWPRGASRLFWPLLLATVLGLLLAAVLGFCALAGKGHAAAVKPADRLEPPQALPAPLESPATDEGMVTAPAPEIPSPTEIPIPTDRQATDRQGKNRQASNSSAAGDSQPATSAADPLVSRFSEHDPDHLILAVRPRPALVELELEIDAAFLALDPRRRDRLARDWQALATALGYDGLVLEGRDGRAFGRSALVGGGMILLDGIGGE